MDQIGPYMLFSACKQTHSYMLQNYISYWTAPFSGRVRAFSPGQGWGPLGSLAPYQFSHSVWSFDILHLPTCK